MAAISKLLGIIKVLIDLFKNILPFLKKKRDKSNSFILFVDDDKFPVVDNLGKAGWFVERVKDVTNIDDEKVKRADIIFIDNKGVGKNIAEKKCGLGLAALIKKSYGKSKRVILYSGYHISLGPDLEIIDGYLDKDIDTFQFELKIRDELKLLR
jgi:hypothetical protein